MVQKKNIDWLIGMGYPALYKANKALYTNGESIAQRKFLRELKNSDLLPKQKYVAIMAFIHGEAYPIRFARSYTDTYLEGYNKTKMLPIRTKRVKEEFIAQGFRGVPYRSDYSMETNLIMGIRKLHMDPRYSFIISNGPVDGMLYIYPEEFANDYNALLEKKRYLISAYTYTGVPGYTKLYNQEGEPK